MVKEFTESDFDTRPQKELPIDVFVGLVALLVVSAIVVLALAVWVLK